MRSMTKRFFSLSITIVLLAILAATFTSTVSAAPVRSASHSAGVGPQWTQVTAKNLQQFFPKAHVLQTNIGPNTVSCLSDSIQSYQNSKFVSTELSYTGSNYAMLRARASGVGPWEKYSICIDNKTNIMTIKSKANGLFVSTELSYTGSNYAMLRARASGVGPWEQYFLNCFNNGYATVCSIQSKANGLFVAEEDFYWGDGYGMLRARTAAKDVNTWEQFIINPA